MRSATEVDLDRGYAGTTATNLSWALVNDVGRHTLDAAFGGLVDGQTYYIQSIDATDHRIALKTTRTDTTAITLDGADRLGVHSIGRVEVDLDADASTGTHALFVNLTSNGTAPQRLLAPSGQSLSSIIATPGNGISTATAQGGQGGLGEFTFPNATLTGSPSVAATLGAGRIEAGTDIELRAISQFNVSASADTDGGGIIAVGKATSSVNLGRSPTTATVADSSVLTAAGDIEIFALNNHTLNSTARSAGGGAFAGKIAYTQATVDNDVNVVVGADAKLTARGAIVINADSQTTARTRSDTYTVALGAGADSDNTNGSTRGVRIGSDADNAERGVTIGGGVQITGRTVDLSAGVSWLDLDAEAIATAYSPIFFGVASAFGDAHIDVYSKAFVQVMNGTVRTTITGTQGVDVETRHAGSLTITRFTDILAVALIFPQEGRARGTDSLTNLVDVDKQALVIVGARTDDPGVGVTIGVGTDTLTAAGHGFENGDRVVIRAATVPSGLALSTPYYVVNAAETTFKLSRTYGGTAVDVTAAGSDVKVVLDRMQPRYSGLRLALFGGAENVGVVLERPADGINYNNSTPIRSGRILWDADVIVLGGLEGSPLLVIDADGKVADARAIKVVNSSGAEVTPVIGQAVPLDSFGGITVAQIQNSGFADIGFRADDDIANGDYLNPPSIPGNANVPWPTFEFRDTLPSVVIVDYSNLNLTIRRIDVVNNNAAGADPLVLIAPNNNTASGFKTKATIEFDLRHSAAPSLVDIEKRGIGTLTLSRARQQPDRPHPHRQPDAGDPRQRYGPRRHEPDGHRRHRHHPRLDRHQHRPPADRPRAVHRQCPCRRAGGRRLPRPAPRRPRRRRRLPEPAWPRPGDVQRRRRRRREHPGADRRQELGDQRVPARRRHRDRRRPERRPAHRHRGRRYGAHARRRRPHDRDRRRWRSCARR